MKSFQDPVILRIEGVGPVPSFKNSKSIFKKKDGTPFIATAPKLKERMQRLEDAIVFALFSWFQTTAAEMDLAKANQLLTALSGLSDDSLNQIPSSCFDVQYVPKGREGIEITIEDYD